MSRSVAGDPEFMMMKMPWSLSVSLLAILSMHGCLDPDVLNESDTFDHHLHFSPSWSPDGRVIAFYNMRGVDRLALVDATTGSISEIISLSDVSRKIDQHAPPVWDAVSSAVYASDDSTVYRISIDGTSFQPTSIPVQIRSITGQGGTAVSRVPGFRDSTTGAWTYRWIFFDLGSGSARSYDVASEVEHWHDGTRRFFFGEQRSDSSGPLLVLLGYDPLNASVDSIGLVRTEKSDILEDAVDISELYFYSLDPQGRRALVFYYLSNYEVSWRYYMVADIDGTHAWSLGNVHRPQWSSDGSRIAFEYPTRAEGGLGTVNADGSGKRILTGPE